MTQQSPLSLLLYFDAQEVANANRFVVPPTVQELESNQDPLGKSSDIQASLALPPVPTSLAEQEGVQEDQVAELRAQAQVSMLAIVCVGNGLQLRRFTASLC